MSQALAGEIQGCRRRSHLPPGIALTLSAAAAAETLIKRQLHRYCRPVTVRREYRCRPAGRPERTFAAKICSFVWERALASACLWPFSAVACHMDPRETSESRRERLVTAGASVRAAAGTQESACDVEDGEADSSLDSRLPCCFLQSAWLLLLCPHETFKRSIRDLLFMQPIRSSNTH